MQPLSTNQHRADGDSTEGKVKSQVERMGEPVIQDELLQQAKDDVAKDGAEKPMTMSEVMLPEIDRVISFGVRLNQSGDHGNTGCL